MLRTVPILGSVLIAYSEKRSFLPLSMLEAVLVEPNLLWVGLMDRNLFKPGVKLHVLHELHRIVTMAGIFSWGRHFHLPESYVP